MQQSKEKIIESYIESIQYVNMFMTIPNDVVRQPIAHGKWSIVEIIGHLIAWDEIVLEKRMPYILSDQPLPLLPFVELINEQAAKEAFSRSPLEVFGKFIFTRKALIRQIERLNEDSWIREFKINHSTLTFASYFSGLIQHDKHHFQQCNDYLIGG